MELEVERRQTCSVTAGVIKFMNIHLGFALLGDGDDKGETSK